MKQNQQMMDEFSFSDPIPEDDGRRQELNDEFSFSPPSESVEDGYTAQKTIPDKPQFKSEGPLGKMPTSMEELSNIQDPEERAFQTGRVLSRGTNKYGQYPATIAASLLDVLPGKSGSWPEAGLEYLFGNKDNLSFNELVQKSQGMHAGLEEQHPILAAGPFNAVSPAYEKKGPNPILSKEEIDLLEDPHQRNFEIGRSMSDQDRSSALTTAAGSALNQATLGFGNRAIAAAGQYGLGSRAFEGLSNQEISDRLSGMQARNEELHPWAAKAGTVAALPAYAYLPEVKALKSFSPALSTIAHAGLYSGLSGLSSRLDPADALEAAGKGVVAGGVLSGGSLVSGKPLIPGGIEGKLTDAIGDITASPEKDLTQKQISIAKSIGLDDDQISKHASGLSRAFNEYGDDPSSARHGFSSSVGIPITKGQALLDPKQLAVETSSGPGGEAAASRTYDIMGKSAEEAAKKYSGTTSSIGESIGNAVKDIKNQADELKMNEREAYRSFGEQPGEFSEGAISNLGEKFINRMRLDDKIRSLTTNDNVIKASNMLDKDLGSQIKFKSSDIEHLSPEEIKSLGLKKGEGDEWYRVPNTPSSVEAARQSLVMARQSASSSGDKQGALGISKLIDQFDSHIENTLSDSKKFRGDGETLKNMVQEARSKHSEYMSRFGDEDRFGGNSHGKLSGSIIDDNESPENITTKMFKMNRSGSAVPSPNTSQNLIKQMKRAFMSKNEDGSYSINDQGLEHINNIKSAYMKDLMTPTDYTPKGFKDVSNRINDVIGSMQEKRAHIGHELFSPEDISHLKDFSHAMDIAGTTRAPFTPETTGKGILRRTLSAVPKMTINPVLNVLQHFIKDENPIYRYGQMDMEANQPLSQKQNIISRMGRPWIPAAQSGKQEHRDGRAVGGKVQRNICHETEAGKLIKLVDKIKKNDAKDTENILNVHDNVVAHALSLANQR